MKHLLISLCCGLVSLPSLAGDSWSVCLLGNMSGMIVDISAIEENNGIKGTWVVIVQPKPIDGWDYTVSWWDINCKTKKVRISDTSTRLFGGITVRKWPDDGLWERAEPGTNGNYAVNYVCKKPLGIFGTYDTIEDAARGLKEKARKLNIWK